MPAKKDFLIVRHSERRDPVSWLTGSQLWEILRYWESVYLSIIYS